MPNSLNNFGTAVGAPEIATQQRLIELFEQNLHYGTVETAAKLYLEWKHDGYDKRDDEREASDLPIEQEAAQFAEKLGQQVYEKRVTFFLELKNDIGQTSGDFLFMFFHTNY